MKNNPASKRGFTLVELSIVLVIIGLLIGGILVAQSMIATTKIQSLARQLGQYDSAVANFYTKFNQIPGDDNLFNTTETGDNNGTIQDANGTKNITNYNGEIGKFWADLSASGLAAQGGAAYTANTAASPMAAGEVATAVAGTNANIIAFGVSGINYYNLARHSTGGANSTIAAAMAFVPADALALDVKMDDGQGNAGNVVGSDALLLTQSVAGNTCVNTQTYVVATATEACAIRVRIGTSTGMK